SHAGGLTARTVTFPDPAPPIVVRQDLRYFPQTGYIVGYAFLAFWNANGGATIFGYPLTNEVIDAGSGLSVQYFERSRFEYHPELNDTPNAIELGQLGRHLLLGQLGLYKPQCSPFYIQKPLLPECR